jgi:arginyl-tRNA synthetase
MHVSSLVSLLRERIAAAVGAVIPEAAGFDPVIRSSDHADVQADGVLALAKTGRRNPRELAAQVAAHLTPDELLAGCEVAGPGFLNLTFTDDALIAQVGRRLAGGRLAGGRLGVGQPEAGTTTVIDYSQPNIAKEMHVGHLRSTIIGDALVRILEHIGGKVVRQNHIGDWGTQFGMLIQHLVEHPQPLAGEPAMIRLGTLYRTARAAFDTDETFADRARQRVVALQAADPQTMALWQDIVAESTAYFTAVYARLDVRLTPADAVGESFYNPMLAGVAADLEASGVATVSDGALCVFFDNVLGPDGAPVPLIVRKSNGGFGYAATDLAAVRHRVTHLHADRILYVVDARQALHFRMVLATARRAGWLPDTVEVAHVAFGTVLGPDGRPFKTRSGETVRLADLLTAAVDRARDVVAVKNPNLSGAALELRARQVGIGAVKYADLSTGRTRDYAFDPQRMVALTGNTGVYLQYAHARIRSILAKAGASSANVALGFLTDHVGTAAGAAPRHVRRRAERSGHHLRATPAVHLPVHVGADVLELLRELSGPQSRNQPPNQSVGTVQTHRRHPADRPRPARRHRPRTALTFVGEGDRTPNGPSADARGACSPRTVSLPVPLLVVSRSLAVVTRVNFGGSAARCMTVSSSRRTPCSTSSMGSAHRSRSTASPTSPSLSGRAAETAPPTPP